MFGRIVLAASLLAAGAAFAQQLPSVRVSGTVESVDGPVLAVKYKGGEQKIVVPPDARILAYAVGDKAELKPGAHVAIIRALKQTDGSLRADRVNVGRGDVVPQ